MNILSGAPAIKLPNGREATRDDMQNYGHVLQSFIRAQEEKLEQVTNSHHHNQIIDYLQILADGYNKELRLFQCAEAQRHQMQLENMIRFVDSQMN